MCLEYNMTDSIVILIWTLARICTRCHRRECFIYWLMVSNYGMADLVIWAGSMLFLPSSRAAWPDSLHPALSCRWCLIHGTLRSTAIAAWGTLHKKWSTTFHLIVSFTQPLRAKSSGNGVFALTHVPPLLICAASGASHVDATTSAFKIKSRLLPYCCCVF